MLLASTEIVIDGGFIGAFFAGLVAFTGALVTSYVKVRQWHKENIEIQAQTAKVAEKAVEDNVAAVEQVHKIVNSRDKAQRALIKELSERLEALSVGTEAQRKAAIKKSQTTRKPKPTKRGK